MRKGLIGGSTWAWMGVGVLLGGVIAQRLVRSYDLRGKVVLITGGGRGLGLVLARRFAERGAKLVLAGRDAHTLAAAREELAMKGVEVLAVPCGVEDPALVAHLVTAAREVFGRIDVLVNNAGRIDVGPVETMTMADYERAMRTHFFGPLRLIEAVLPEMRMRGEGRIVNVSSIGGVVAVPHLLPYSASKFALRGLSEGLRAELAKDGIVVTTVCPGLMRTGSTRNARFKGKHRDEYAWFALGDALPITSISADRAARRIVRACERGEAEVILSLPAKLVAWAHGLAPSLVARVLGLVNRSLPSAGGIGIASRSGAESRNALTGSPLVALDDRAAARNNELGAAERGEAHERTTLPYRPSLA